MVDPSAVEQIAREVGLAVGLVVDPFGESHERWVSTIGLDAFGAGPTPEAALNAALDDLRAQEGMQPICLLSELIG